jgi:formiminoglutamase
MFDNWLKPFNKKELNKTHNFKSSSLFTHVQEYNPESENFPKVDFAIITMDSVSSNAIRKALYELSTPFPKIKIIDLGVSRNNESNFITPVIQELLLHKTIPIIIGSSVVNTLSQFNAYKILGEIINCCILDEKINLSKEFDLDCFYMNEIYKSYKKNLNNLSFIGHQRHFLNNYAEKITLKNNFDIHRLGEIQNNVSNMEPVVRDANMFSINLSVLKGSETPDWVKNTPSGITSEMLCQLSRFAGNSDKMTSLGIYGFDTLSLDSKTAQIVAQIIWYFMDGYHNRMHSYPVSMKGLEKISVYMNEIDKEIKFYYSKVSDKWWIEMPYSNKKYIKHSLVPITFDDFNDANNGSLSERIHLIFKRFL